MDKNILITGRPRTGKSTLISKLIEFLKLKGKKIGGILTPEIKEKSRVGFKIIDIGSGKEGILAHVNQKNGPRISKYRVNMDDLENIGVNGIKSAISNSDIIIIDEIGKMELFSKEFCNVILEAIDEKKVVGTIGYNLSHPIADQIIKRKDIELIVLTIQNRDDMTIYLKNKIN